MISATALGGIGLRAPHLAEIDRVRPATGLLEIHAENYLSPSPAFTAMERVRADYRFSVHAVGLSLGAVDGLDAAHLARVAALVKRLQPDLVDHLSWSTTICRCLIPRRRGGRAQPRPAAGGLAGNLGENPSCYVGFVH